MAHHLFSCWHGDFRLRRKYGEVWFAPTAVPSPLAMASSGIASMCEGALSEQAPQAAELCTAHAGL